jgi:hypothetical protein
LWIIGENFLNRKERKKMKKYEIGNIVKTKEGNKCVILDFIDDEVIVFNLSELHPDKIKMDDIVEKIKEAKGTTIIIDKNNNDSDNTKENTEETEDNIENKFAELLKVFGKAAIELGEIFVKIAESDEDEQ